MNTLGFPSVPTGSTPPNICIVFSGEQDAANSARGHAEQQLQPDRVQQTEISMKEGPLKNDTAYCSI